MGCPPLHVRNEFNRLIKSEQHITQAYVMAYLKGLAIIYLGGKTVCCKIITAGTTLG